MAYGESGLDVALEETDERVWPRCGGGVEANRAVGKLPPEALAVKAALAVSLDHGPVMERVAPQLVVELIVATIEFAAAEPWCSSDVSHLATR